MTEFETASEVRLEIRRVLHGVIDAWVHGPVDLLAVEDLNELRMKMSEEWTRRGWGARKGYRYACYCAEVKLLLGLPEPLKGIRDKGAAGRSVIEELPEQSENLGELFAR